MLGGRRPLILDGAGGEGACTGLHENSTYIRVIDVDRRLHDLLNHEIPNREDRGGTLAENTSPHRHIHTDKHLNAFCKSVCACFLGNVQQYLVDKAKIKILMDRLSFYNFPSLCLLFSLEMSSNSAKTGT